MFNLIKLNGNDVKITAVNVKLIFLITFIAIESFVSYLYAYETCMVKQVYWINKNECNKKC